MIKILVEVGPKVSPGGLVHILACAVPAVFCNKKSQILHLKCKILHAERGNFCKKFCNISTQPNFLLCNGNTAVICPQSLILIYLNVDPMRNNYNKAYGSRYVNFVNNINFQFWLQLQSKLMVAMNTGLNLYQAEYRID